MVALCKKACPNKVSSIKSKFHDFKTIKLLKKDVEGSLAVKVSEESEISRQVDALQHLEVEAGIVTRVLLTE